jgi:hypothetical protein
MSKEQFRPSHINDTVEKERSIRAQNEWERQIGNYLKLGFHIRLGLSIEDYFSSMPRLPLTQKESVEPFDRLVIVEPRIPPRIQLMLAGFSYHAKDTLVCQPETSEVPYITLLRTDSRVLRDIHTPDKTSPTIQEGAALLIAHPEVLDGPPIALFGSKIYSLEGNSLQEKIPCLYKWSGGQAGIGADVLGYLEDDNAKTATCVRVY